MSAGLRVGNVTRSTFHGQVRAIRGEPDSRFQFLALDDHLRRLTGGVRQPARKALFKSLRDVLHQQDRQRKRFGKSGKNLHQHGRTAGAAQMPMTSIVSGRLIECVARSALCDVGVRVGRFSFAFEAAINSSRRLGPIFCR